MCSRQLGGRPSRNHPGFCQPYQEIKCVFGELRINPNLCGARKSSVFMKLLTGKRSTGISTSPRYSSPVTAYWLAMIRYGKVKTCVAKKHTAFKHTVLDSLGGINARHGKFKQANPKRCFWLLIDAMIYRCCRSTSAHPSRTENILSNLLAIPLASRVI